MPRSSTTFPKGRGASRGAEAKGTGWGGPAKGTGPRPDSLRLADGTYNPNPQGATRELRDLAQARRERAYAVLDGAMQDGDTWHVRVIAADKMLDRLDGKAKQAVEQSGEVSYIIKTGVPRADRD